MANGSVTPRVLLGSKDVFVETSRFRFSASGFATGASAFDDRVCLGSCVILVHRPSAWSQSVPRSVSTCLPRGNLVDGLPRAPSISSCRGLLAVGRYEVGGLRLSF